MWFIKYKDWIFGFFTVAAFVFGIYWYFDSQKSKEISYSVREDAAKIFDNENSTPVIRLLERDTVPIKQNVYLITGKIWNSGDLTIDSSEERVPLSIHLEGCTRILDYRIIKDNKPGISSFYLNRQDNQTLRVHWKYFDPKYGFEYQIIYLGNPTPKVKISGEYAPPFRELVRMTEVASPSYKQGILELLGLLFCSVGTLIGSKLSKTSWQNTDKKSSLVRKVVLIIGAILLITFLYFIFCFLTKMSTSPI